jgi:hypothetical protein
LTADDPGAFRPYLAPDTTKIHTRALKKLQITDEALTVSLHEFRLVVTNVEALDSIGAAL